MPNKSSLFIGASDKACAGDSPAPSTSPARRPGESTIFLARPIFPPMSIGAFILYGPSRISLSPGVPIGHFPELVRALALVKQAAARANRRLGHLSVAKTEAIDRACELVAKDKGFLDQFVVDAVQGGAGTSTNMNANEVVANLALELMGKSRGEYAALHPIDDVNMAQSTNDALPYAALRLAMIFGAKSLAQALQDLAFAFKAKAGRVRAMCSKLGARNFRTRCR